MGKLTTHVLDTMHGRPAAGVQVELLRMQADGAGTRIAQGRTNADGRLDAPLLEGQAMTAGRYALVFHAGDYFAAQGVALPKVRFLDQIAIPFGIDDAAAHYHVPLLVSPYGYSTYRGS